MSLRILIVEDEQIVAADLEAKLKRLGHAIVGTAASGEEAVRLAEQFRPEAVMMDIQLQGNLTGIETGRQIQKMIAAQIIFVTAYAGVFLKDPGQMQPPGICLSKPFSSYQLQVALNAVNQNPPG